MAESTPTHADRIVAQIFSVFRERGHRHYGESVSEQEHALQTAEFARQYSEPDALVLSCLLHDYGHMLHDLGENIADQGVDARHEELGAWLLKDWFPEEILQPIRQHVASKRYLCWRNTQYRDGLSPSSQRSLQLQGGPMSEQEASEFEALQFFDQCVRLRLYDDMGKVPQMPTATIESYEPLIRQFLKPDAVIAATDTCP
ncbi:phosphodiesterase [Planctomycetia bacterium]|nr:phosphodiesterase [Planctomycetia bacterium]